MEVKLPKTSFSQKANGKENEPLMLKFWEDRSIFAVRTVDNKSKGGKEFILHDGPPYANGEIHIGHIFNKSLKDIINKYHLLKGDSVRFVPTFDCHGLPTELKAVKGNKELDAITIRKICEKYSREQAGKQIETFKRFGIIGQWNYPVLTIDKDYETKQLEVLYTLFTKELIFKKEKPTMYSPSTKTVLAQAEIEYMDAESEALYVLFPTNDNRYLLAYTTTEWTLAGNQALCVSPNIEYVEFVWEGKTVISSKKFAEKNGFEFKSLGDEIPSLYETWKLVLSDDFVLDDFTGIVHLCGGHGEDDFDVLTKHGITPKNVCDLKDLEQHVQNYKYDGLVFKREKINHSYPHDWRTKKPIYYALTEQFFVDIEKLKPELNKAIENVDWTSDRFKNRMTSSVNMRKEWCISRQRVWGFPLVSFINKETKEVEFNLDMFNYLKPLFYQHGSNVWFENDVDFLLPETYRGKYEKTKDTIDVWFDSGCSWAAVLDGKTADVYLEGLDQHRGWFQSSLILSVIMTGKAPYKKVVTHDFVLDENGKKISKSEGNYVEPIKMIEKFNTDVIRLWAISNDYESSIKVGDKLLDQCFKSYFKIRNSLKYLVSNLYDYEKDAPVHLSDNDNNALRMFNNVEQQMKTLYENYKFREMYALINDYFASLSSSYFTLENKISLYETGGQERTNIQYVFSVLAQRLPVLLAPITPFLCEEFYQVLKTEVPDLKLKGSVFFEKI